MQVIIAGRGKLANELLSELRVKPPLVIDAWSSEGNGFAPSIVVHAGSGRELPTVLAHCAKTRSPLIELSTGSQIGIADAFGFPVVLCPNTNILMLKFMALMARSGDMFRDCKLRLTESHQASKASVPGTAVNLAASLGVHPRDIVSIRDPDIQRTTLAIAEADLLRHAFHQVLIEADGCTLKLESMVVGDRPYADGVARIIEATYDHQLEDRVYSVMEFVDAGWI